MKSMAHVLAGLLSLGKHESHRTFHSSASLTPRRSLQVHLPIQPVPPLGVDSPALPPEYHGDAPVAKGGVAQRQFPNPLLEFLRKKLVAEKELVIQALDEILIKKF